MCLQYLTNKIKLGEWPQVQDLTIVGDDMTKWRFKLRNFDSDLEGGRTLNDDLNVIPTTPCTWIAQHHTHRCNVSLLAVLHIGLLVRQLVALLAHHFIPNLMCYSDALHYSLLTPAL